MLQSKSNRDIFGDIVGEKDVYLVSTYVVTTYEKWIISFKKMSTDNMIDHN